MITDVSRIIRQYRLQYKSIGSSPSAKTKLGKCRDSTTKIIASIIPHRCGDHATCCYEDYKIIQLQRHFIVRHMTEFPDKDEDEVSTKELFRFHISRHVVSKTNNFAIVLVSGELGVVSCKREDNSACITSSSILFLG